MDVKCSTNYCHPVHPPAHGNANVCPDVFANDSSSDGVTNIDSPDTSTDHTTHLRTNTGANCGYCAAINAADVHTDSQPDGNANSKPHRYANSDANSGSHFLPDRKTNRFSNPDSDSHPNDHADPVAHSQLECVQCE